MIPIWLVLFQVWHAGYPARVKYYADMKEFQWKYTQYSQFNDSDSLLLVSGVHFGSHSTSGEIAVFSLIGKYPLFNEILCNINAHFYLAPGYIWFHAIVFSRWI